MGGKGDEMLDRSPSAKAACSGWLASGGSQGRTALPFAEANSAAFGVATPGLPSVPGLSRISHYQSCKRFWTGVQARGPMRSRQSRLTAAARLPIEGQQAQRNEMAQRP